MIEDYIKELTSLGERFLDLVAEALSLSVGTFQPFLSDQHRLKLVHYPASPVGDSTVSQQGVGPHKDSSGWWTFLLQASPPEVKGLQVLNKAGDWVNVPVVPGTFVVNIGQAFEVVTNGVCKATTHRVLSGPHERYSVPFFQGVRRDLTKAEAVETLKAHFDGLNISTESEEGHAIDSAFLKGKYNTWENRNYGQRYVVIVRMVRSFIPRSTISISTTTHKSPSGHRTAFRQHLSIFISTSMGANYWC